MKQAADVHSGSNSKRLDLQGIRGLAIISVLGFHFYPSWFPNGYLGVDQFFVLSGFLMCMLLKRSEQLPTFSLITTFYSKRFKRILPLYLLIIAISLIALYTVFPDTAIETNRDSATKALFFASNRPKTTAEDYFQMLSIAIDIFTHTWSLSVEIQFYFLVPVIFIIGSRFSHDPQIFYYCLICGISYIFYSISSPTVAFNSVYSRIWQFLIGMIVYLWTDSKKINDYTLLENEIEDLELGKEMTRKLRKSRFDRILFGGKLVFLFSMCYIMSYPKEIPSFISRPYVTIATGCVMSVSDGDKILSNRFLTYIGDISYSLYLIHWPIYAYWKLELGNDQMYLLICLTASIILAIITYETFEKWYLKRSFMTISLLIVALYGVSLLIINKDLIQEQMETKKHFARLDGVTDNMTLDDAEKLNHQWSVNDNRNLFSPTCQYDNPKTKDPLGWCNHKNLSKTAKYKMTIFGNSWTANHATMFYQECHNKANGILQGAAFGCEPLYPTNEERKCKKFLTTWEERLAKYKPDIAFIFTRHISVGKASNNSDHLDMDPTYKIMKTQLNKYLKHIKKKLYILDAVPWVNRGFIKNVVKQLREHKKLTDIDKKMVDMRFFDMARRRYAQLFKDCGEKCERIDYVPEFYNNSTKTFRYFDERGFSYFTSPNHMSPHGLEHVRHIYTKLCNDL